MIEKLPDWYRVVDPNPSPDKIQRRKDALSEIVAALKTKEAIAECILFLTLKSPQTTEFIAQAIEIIRNHDSSFTTNVENSRTELTVLFSTCLGELISKSKGRKNSRFAAISIISSVGIIRPLQINEPRAYQHMISELYGLALANIQSSARRTRQRPELGSAINTEGIFQNPNLSPEDMNLLKDALKRLQEQVLVVAKHNAIINEEIETLWWSYSNVSKILNKPFHELSLSTLLLCAPCELASIVNIPPLESAFYLLGDIIARSNHELSTELTVKELFADATALVCIDQFAMQFDATLATSYPPLAPISWIVQRLIDSEGTADWSREFTSKTGIKSSLSSDVQSWSSQIIWERLAQRVFEE